MWSINVSKWINFSFYHSNYKHYSLSNFSICPEISIGLVVGAKRSRGIPFLSIKNFVKFHLIELPNVPLCLCFRNLNNGSASSPFTFTFFMTSPTSALALFKWQTCEGISSRKKSSQNHVSHHIFAIILWRLWSELITWEWKNSKSCKFMLGFSFNLDWKRYFHTWVIVRFVKCCKLLIVWFC